MLVRLTGEVVYRGSGFLVVDVSGIGYKVIVPDQIAHTYTGQTTLYTHEVIRENERELFGFVSMDALELFWKLIAISGVGPRIAQKIVSADRTDLVKSKIMSGQLDFLIHIPGVGKKTAQKIILELKGVLADEPDVSTLDTDAVEALIGLGYPRRDAEHVLSQIEAESTDERIRVALKLLAR